jgi:hypothetical protein
MKEQTNSPLELYERAYKLQYDENRTAEACRLYKAIIDEFPDTNECGYAVIQLEKILASAVSEKIVVSSRWTTVLAVVSMAVSIAALIGVILAGTIYTSSVNARLSNLTLVSQALGKLAVGKDREAIEILDNAKSVSGSKDMTAYLLSADIFLKKQQYSKPMAEFDTVKKQSDAQAVAQQEIANADEKALAKKTIAEKKPDAATLQMLKTEPPAKEAKPKVEKEVPSAPKAQKQHKPSAPQKDSISFF